jgi:hypothetical protein
MAYVRTRNEAYTAQQWRLVQSVDEGQTWTTLHEETSATNPPVIETDAEDNLYLVRPDFKDGHAYLYRFLAEKEYKEPVITRIDNGAAGKYGMAIDLSRKLLYYASHNGFFAITGLDGTLKQSSLVLVPGPNAQQQYPLLALGADGVLHFAYTTVKNDAYLYWDIHYLRSPDAGGSWQKFSGEALATPLISDDTGPTDRLTRDDEFSSHTWLSSMAIHKDKLHFAYLTQSTPAKQNYFRLNAQTGEREVDVSPKFGGKKLEVMGLDGWFASDGETLFYTSGFGGKITSLRSTDNGETWKDHAQSEATYNTYSISGCRTVTAGGKIIGAFTDQRKEPEISKLYFISQLVADAQP